METTNTKITNTTRRKDRTLPLRAREVSRYADDKRRYKEKQSHAEAWHTACISMPLSF